MSKPEHSGQGAWPLGPEGVPPINDQDLLDKLPLFVAAAAKARRLHEQKKLRVVRLRQIITISSAALLMLATGVGLIAIAFVHPVAAGIIPQFTGSLLSSFDNLPLAGVYVYQSDPAGDAGQPKLIGISDPLGTFCIPAGEAGQARTISFGYRDQMLDYKLIVGQNKHELLGTDVVYLDIPHERRSSEYSVSLAPGGSAFVDPRLRISLDKAATAPWSGTITDDMNWPSNFRFGQVARGVISVKGAYNPHLLIAAFVEDTLLKNFNCPAGKLELIAQSEKYRQAEERSEAYFKWSRSFFHRGWYQTKHPPAAYLPSVVTSTEAAATSADLPEAGVWISWEPAPTVQYAVIAPPSSDGELYACTVFSDRTGKMQKTHGLRILGLISSQPWLYDYLYANPAQQSSVEAPTFYFMPGYEHNFDEISYPRDDMARKHPLPSLMQDSGVQIPGTYTMRRYDFTFAEPREFGPLVADYRTPSGNYDVQVEMHDVGQAAKLRLTGDLARLSDRPAWDIFADGIIEKYGPEIDLTIPRPGFYRVRAILQEQCGNRVIVDKLVYCPEQHVRGYWDEGRASVRVLAGVAQAPKELTALRVRSFQAANSSSAYGISASPEAGPMLLVNPPAEFRNIPLARLDLTFFASPRGVDALDMELQPRIHPVSQVTGNPPFFVTIGDWLSADQMAALNLSLPCYRLEAALVPDDSGSPPMSIEEALEYIGLTDQGKAALRLGFGLNLNALPPHDELMQKLHDFQLSKFFLTGLATKEKQEFEWSFNLFGGKLAQQQNLMVGVDLSDYGVGLWGQWDIYSGGECPTQVTLIAADGSTYTEYFDYSQLD